MTSRDLKDLHPDFRPLAEKFLDACRRFELNVVVTCTLRSMEDQAREFRKGRDLEAINRMRSLLETNWMRPDLGQLLMDVGPQDGSFITTKAGPGMSLHNYGYALDGAPLDGGRYPKDGSPLWGQYTNVALESGLNVISWDRPHVEMPGVRWQELIVVGR
jgi:hypothetical protein